MSIVCAIALALAFPKVNAAWLAPAGAAGLLWTWQRHSYKRTFFLGWFAGAIFFAISFSWFGYTVGGFVGPLAPILVAAPALFEGVFFGLAAVLAAFAFARAPRNVAPLAAAAGFTVMEWARSVGVLGVPFAQLGYSQANSPLAVFAAYAGTYGVTFIICTLGAYGAAAIARGANRQLVVAVAIILIAWCGAWFAWPARHAAPATLRVAAVQGNIKQNIKWDKASLKLAVARYTELTLRTQSFAPRVVVWPETVMTTALTQNPEVAADVSTLARRMQSTVIAGSIDVHNAQEYNALFFFSPGGYLYGLYDKRQLVPFAESFPGRAILGWIPYANLISGFDTGHNDAVFDGGGLQLAPLICWESAFSDLAYNQVRAGAQFFIISTDDAWFGESAGPYMHAQIAQLRAIEYGRWIVRAASTGVSGIIAPDGRYVEQTDLDRQAVVLGTVGAPPGSAFAHIGPTNVIFVIAALYLALLFLRRRVDA